MNRSGRGVPSAPMMCDSLWQIEKDEDVLGLRLGLGHAIKLIIATWRCVRILGQAEHPEHVPSAAGASLLWFIRFHLLSLGPHKI